MQVIILQIMRPLLKALVFFDASASWLLKKTTGIRTHYFYKITPDNFSHKRNTSEPGPSNYQFRSISSIPDLYSLAPEKADHLARNSGTTPSHILENGGRIYALVQNGSICCQTNIEFGSIFVTTPFPLSIRIPDNAYFISFLHTPPEHRGKGYAQTLLHRTCEYLASENMDLGICHIRSTNVASRLAFRNQGWRRAALIFYTGRGRLISSLGTKSAGILIKPCNIDQPRD